VKRLQSERGNKDSAGALTIGLEDSNQRLAVIRDPRAPFSLRIGRGPECEIVIPQSVPRKLRGSVSRTHARLYSQLGQIWVEDLDSQNFTYLDDRVVLIPTVVEPPCVLRLGSLRLSLALDSTVSGDQPASASPADAVAPAATGATDSVTPPHPMDRTKMWREFRRDLRWVSAIQDLAMLVGGAKRAAEVHDRLTQILLKYLDASRVVVALVVRQDGITKFLTDQGIPVKEAAAAQDSCRAALEKLPVARTTLAGGKRILWIIEPTNVSDPIVSLILADYEDGPKNLSSPLIQDAIVADSVWLAKPHLDALREVEQQRASVRHSIEAKPSAVALRVCDYEQFWGHSSSFQRVIHQAEIAATRYLSRLEKEARPPTLLILGESGTGKSALAKIIHRLSKRAGGPFFGLNCAALPVTLAESELFGYERGAHDKAYAAKPGFFESARDGTLFLDEIGKAPHEFQSKLLKVLDSGEFYRLGGTRLLKTNCYVVLADSESIAARSGPERFLPELWYRVSGFTMVLPPLRERPEDIEVIVDKTLETLNEDQPDGAAKSASARLMAILRAHSWPGNVRELRQCMEAAYAMCPPECDRLEPDHLPASTLSSMGFRGRLTTSGAVADPAAPFEEYMKAMERAYFARLLRMCDGNLAEVSRRSGKSYQTVLNKLDAIAQWLRATADEPNNAAREELKQLAGDHWRIIERRLHERP
jgi:DNA-binding NtrC family response regulator